MDYQLKNLMNYYYQEHYFMALKVNSISYYTILAMLSYFKPIMAN